MQLDPVHAILMQPFRSVLQRLNSESPVAPRQFDFLVLQLGPLRLLAAKRRNQCLSFRFIILQFHHFFHFWFQERCQAWLYRMPGGQAAALGRSSRLREKTRDRNSRWRPSPAGMGTARARLAGNLAEPCKRRKTFPPVMKTYRFDRRLKPAGFRAGCRGGRSGKFPHHQ